MENPAVSTAVPTCRFATEESNSGPLCHCHGVGEDEVHGAIHGGGASSVEDVMQRTKAGTGCGACRCRINRVLEGLPAKCGGRFDFCHGCGCISAICQCEAA